MTGAGNPIASVWTRQRPQAREQLTRGQIVAAALALLDAEGTEAFSMRKLGSGLDAAATSLYRHVAGKDEVLQLAVDEVYGEVAPPDGPGRDGWRAAAAETARETRAMVLRHPWVAAELGQVGLVHIGPNAMRATAGLREVFAAAGFPAGEREQAMGTLMAFVIGTATAEAAYLSVIARSGRSEREWVEALRPGFDEAAREHGAPGAESSAPSGSDDGSDSGADPRQSRDESFAYGLDRVLDGLAARLP